MKVVPTIPAAPHWSGPDHYWAVLRDGSVERTSRSLRQCEVGAIRGESLLCRLGATDRDPTCPRCAQLAHYEACEAES